MVLRHFPRFGHQLPLTYIFLPKLLLNINVYILSYTYEGLLLTLLRQAWGETTIVYIVMLLISVCQIITTYPPSPKKRIAYKLPWTITKLTYIYNNNRFYR